MQNSQKSPILGAEELVRKSNETVASLCTGSKKNIPDRTDQELARLAELYGNLRDILCLERIGTEKTRLIGEYSNSTKKVHLTKLCGTLQSFGQANELNGTFLEPHEALYLLEMNRLVIYYNTTVVSLEQAYEICLKAESGLSLEEYFVFSTLSKLGYIVKKFDAKTTYSKEISFETDDTESPSGSKRKKQEFEGSPTKKLKTDDALWSYTGKSTVNDLINLPTSEGSAEDKFQGIFESFDVIKLAPGRGSSEQGGERLSALKYNFDVYNPRKIFKKSQPPPPDYRVLVLRFEEKCPERDDLLNLYNRCEPRSPIIAVYVDDYLKMSGFLYKFA